MVEGGHEEGTPPSDGGQDGVDHRVGPADDVPDAGERAVYHDVHSGLQAERPEVGHELRL